MCIIQARLLRRCLKSSVSTLRLSHVSVSTRSHISRSFLALDLKLIWWLPTKRYSVTGPYFFVNFFQCTIYSDISFPIKGFNHLSHVF